MTPLNKKTDLEEVKKELIQMILDHRKKMIPWNKGKRNYSWKGSRVGYRGLHLNATIVVVMKSR